MLNPDRSKEAIYREYQIELEKRIQLEKVISKLVTSDDSPNPRWMTIAGYVLSIFEFIALGVVALSIVVLFGKVSDLGTKVRLSESSKEFCKEDAKLKQWEPWK